MYCSIYGHYYGCDGADARADHVLARMVIDPLIACLPVADIRRARWRERWRGILAAYWFFIRHPIVAYERKSLALMFAFALGGPIGWLRIVWGYITHRSDNTISDEDYARGFVVCWIRRMGNWCSRGCRLDDSLLPMSRADPQQWFLEELGGSEMRLTKEILTIFRTNLINRLRVADVVVPCDISNTLSPLLISMNRHGTIRATAKQNAWLKKHRMNNTALPPRSCSDVLYDDATP